MRYWGIKLEAIELIAMAKLDFSYFLVHSGWQAATLRHFFRPKRDAHGSAACRSDHQPTFSDALARVRSRLWQHRDFSSSAQTTDVVKSPTALPEQLTETLGYAA